ncbi:unnamed protein product [Kluyveromyces dobzhanskii CBS 2104]|uniref:WGS project CCBQ000000000 data, contig 00046 n=1 Tax=Kluyveromyces dobzhanskii CBS 2104 TaxID=1427455 RepID=A0A0A8L9E5_9SACH|nr:unnamed protein product [Kluyveromyces dobzhanskii CBS 2104]
MYIKHVSFQDLSPSLIDDQVRYLKDSNKPISYNNTFIHVPPQFNPMCVDPSQRVDSQSGSLSNDSAHQDISSRKSHTSLDMGFVSPQNGSFTKNALKPSLSNEYSDYDMMMGLHKSKTALSSLSSRSTSLVRAPTSSSTCGRLPPAPAVSILKQESKEDLADESSSPDGIDLTVETPQMEKTIEKITTNNTLENSGNKFGTGYTTSAFANLNEFEDKLMQQQKAKAEPDKKKKSYVDMTDEELAVLERQLRSGGRQTSTDLNHFDFSQQNKLYIGSTASRPSVSTKNSKSNAKSADLTLTYPSRPSITHKAISITKEHDRYRKLYPEEEGRTIVCFINGRRHTWATADWFIKEAARDGDHLVIATSLPMYEELINIIKKNSASEHCHSQVRLEEYTFDGKIKNKTPSAVVELPFRQLGLIINQLDHLTTYKCENILNYYASKCEEKVMKVTVELVKEVSPKSYAIHLMDLYRPDFHIVSTISTNLSIKFRNGHVKLPNFLYRHLWVPTIVIPYEFIDPYKLGECTKPKRKVAKAVTIKEASKLFDKCIIKSLNDSLGKDTKNSMWNDAFNHEEHPAIDDSSEGSDADDKEDILSIDSDQDEDVAEYFPMSPEALKRKQHIERLGYIPPEPSRLNTNSLAPASSRNSTRSSRRSSRVFFADEPGMYKVKSLLGDADDSSNTVRKTKSEMLSTNSTPKRPTTSFSHSAKIQHTAPTYGTAASKKSTSSGKLSIPALYVPKSTSTATSSSSVHTQSHSKSKSKSKVGGMFKKLFGAKG